MISVLDTSNPADGEEQSSPQRGFLFVGWLTILSLGAVVTAYYAITETPIILEQYPDSPRWALYGKTALSFLNIVFFGAIWMWRRLGIYGLIGSTISIFLINGFSGYSWLESSYGFIGLLLLLLFVRLKGHWRHFR